MLKIVLLDQSLSNLFLKKYLEIAYFSQVVMSSCVFFLLILYNKII